MDDIVSSPPEPNPRKRAAPEQDSPDRKPLNLKGNQFMMPTPPDTDNSSNVSPAADVTNDDNTRAASPAPSSSGSALSSVIENTHDTNVQSSATTVGASSSGPPPAKRRKLTPAERLEKQQLKEAKEREKAEQKARRDEEKRVQDEEKRRKAEEREAKKRVQDEEKRRIAEEKEAKKREKELKEEQKNQDKLKKERSQMRLGAFFQRGPATPAKPSSVNADVDEDDDGDAVIRARRRSLSLDLYDNVAEQIKTPAEGTPPPPSVKTPVPSVSDYHKAFLPFELQSHCRMPPIPQPASEAAQDAFEQELRKPSLKEKFDLGLIDLYQEDAEMRQRFAGQAERGTLDPDIQMLMDTISGTSHQPIDLTGEGSTESALVRLREVPIRYVHFDEDVRPAYCGTYTKIRSPRTVRKVKRNPFTRARPDTNYDYDSEAEWEEPKEDDEEILSEEEDEADSQADGNEINDFLDDEDDDKGKRKVITGELVPESTGLCWMGCAGHAEKQEEMDGMSMGVLLSNFSGTTIDPFSTAYWDLPSTQPPAAQANEKPASFISPMPPPRLPLQPRLNVNGGIDKTHDIVGAAAGAKGPITSSSVVLGAKRGPKPAPKTLSEEDMAAFTEAIVGSDLGKLELQKGLKVKFPKMTNEVIKETLSSQFAQVGKTKAEKRWVRIMT